MRTESAFVTSSFTSRKTQITALATDSLDAQLVFDTVDLSLLDGATATVTGSGVADFSQTHVRSSASRRTGSQSTGTTVAAGGSGAESGQFSAAGKLSGAWDWRLWVWGMVGIGVGVGMVVI